MQREWRGTSQMKQCGLNYQISAKLLDTKDYINYIDQACWEERGELVVEERNWDRPE